MADAPKILDLKSTLNLPRTSFPMKANLPDAEPRQLAEWDRIDIYRKIQDSRAGAPLYMLHDGPPYPTGNIHLGTGLNKILKDMVVKSKTMAGFRAPYLPGWDCHGLPIETQVEKELGQKGSVSPVDFRRRCREFAARYVDAHRRDFKRLGVFGQWNDPYLTMSADCESVIADTFVTLLETGYVYRGLKPVYWCIHDRTALAEAEVEYENHTSPSVWVKFPVVADSAAAKVGSGVSAVIWTTTPWTLPHNRALCFHPDFEYVVVDSPAGSLLVALQRLKELEAETKLTLGAVRSGWKGRELEGLKFQHPFLGLRVPAVLGEYVTLDQGSGIVHTAPGHGAEDFYTGQKYGLETHAPLDDDGRFLEGLPEYKGKTVFESNAPIVTLLEKRGALLAQRNLEHSYPHCWRCHNPVIFRATEQWFISLEHDNLRKRTLAEIAKAKWTPAWGEERIHNMIATRPDWCISRQRFWGVPLVIFYCRECNERLDDIAALRRVVGWFRKEGADAWFAHSPEELLPPGTKCKCGATRWRQENDILDVWFESGSTHFAVLKEKEGEWPADLYLEASDQYRGWFHSSLLLGVAVRRAAPYRHVLCHGWTLDEQGRPMSKSLGNIILPNDICNKWGADLLRLWVCSQDYTTEMRMTDRVMTQLAEGYRKIRNTFRFALSNLDGFDPSHNALAAGEMWDMDRWMLHRAADLAQQCRAWYDNFEFHRVYHALHDFCAVELSAFYFDVLKDRLYTFAPRSAGRRSAQTAVYRIASALLRLVAPLLVYTSEEIWKYFPKAPGDPDSIHMAHFPQPEELDTNLSADKLADWDTLLQVRNEVLKALEPARQTKFISSALEARVGLRAQEEMAEFLNRYAAILPALFIVSQVQITQGPVTVEPVLKRSPGDGNGAVSFEGVEVTIRRADGKKCERCWNYSTHVGASSVYPTICERCISALEEIERSAGNG
jgi:isoleucyl-tRNA synthetase